MNRNNIPEESNLRKMSPLHSKSAAFGDLLSEDVKAYRDQFLTGRGMRGLYLVWRWGGREFVGEFNSQFQDHSFVGRIFNEIK